MDRGSEQCSCQKQDKTGSAGTPTCKLVGNTGHHKAPGAVGAENSGEPAPQEATSTL